MKSQKLLSLLLTVVMVFSMLPAAALGAGEAALSTAGVYTGEGEGLSETSNDSLSSTGEAQKDIEITAFNPISVNAGVAGSVAYEDAAAVMEYLNESYDSVTANTYGGGTVAVPVTEWTETDTYDPAVAGSYTFTATLGDILEGYANSGNLTATAEVVVAEDAGTEESGPGVEAETPVAPTPLSFDAGTVSASVYDEEIAAFPPITVDGGIAGAATYTDAGAVIAYLNANYASVTAHTYDGGTVAVPVTAWTDIDTYNPAVAGSYSFTATLGDLPAGYDNPNNLTATAEVVVKDPADEPASIPDANLKAGICQALGQDPATYTVTVGDMESLTALDLSNRGITDLTGIKYAVNLKRLNLSGNPIGESVRNSTIEFNKVYAELAHLTLLEHLDLSGCLLDAPAYVGGIPTSLSTALSGFANLVTLDLSDAELTGGFALSSSTQYAKLTHMDLSGNYLQYFSAQAGNLPAIQHIDLSDNWLYMVEGVTGFTQMLEIGTEKFDVSNQKNRAVLAAVRVKNLDGNFNNASGYKQYFFGAGKYEADIGEVFGNSLSFMLTSWDEQGTVIVDGASTTPRFFKQPSGGSSAPVELTGLAEGAYTLTLQSSHPSGDTRTYRIKFHVEHVPQGDESAGITDPVLQKAICAKLPGAPDYTTHVVTKEEMASITGTLSLAGLTDASGLEYAENITGLSITSGTMTALPDLSRLTKLTSLNLQANQQLTSLPALDSLTELTTLSVYSAFSLGSFPDIGALTKLTSLTIRYTAVTEPPAGLENCTNITTLTLDNNLFTYLPEGISGLSGIKTLNVASNRISALPDSVGSMTNLTSINASANNLSTLPDLSGLPLQTLNISGNRFTAIPETVFGIATLKTLNISSNPLAEFPQNIKNLANLQTLTAQYCNLSEIPAALYETEFLVSLDLQNNSIAKADGSMAGWTNMTTLNLGSNRLDEMPAGIRELTAIKTLGLGFNLLTVIPRNMFDNCTTLTKLDLYGNFIKYNQATQTFEDGDTATAIAKLKENCPGVSLSPTPIPSHYFAKLKSLDSSAGRIDGIEANPADPYLALLQIIKTVPGGVDSITFTPVAVVPDTTITIGEQTVSSGESITVMGLVNGENIIDLLAYNPYNGPTITYRIHLYVGAAPVEEGGFPKEGAVYNIGIKAIQQHSNAESMANSYLAPTSRLEVSSGKIYAYFTTTRNDWMYDMKHKNSDGEYVPVEIANIDEANNSTTYKLEISDFDEILQVSAYVVPMGYAPLFRLVFDKATLVELVDSGTPPEPGDPADGEYTIPVRLWHAVNDQASMGDAALEHNTKLVIEEGAATLHLHFKPLEFMGMTGYLSQLDLLDDIVFNENNYPVDYDLIPATVISTYDVVDEFNHPESSDPNCAGKPYPKEITVPVTLEQEYTWVHVYVPVMGSMGFGDQVARIKLDWSNLSEGGGGESTRITAFDPITIDGGTTASPAYGDTAAVIAHLNGNYASVTANDGAVSVPVAAWTDTEGYDPSVAGSYTFTATLGELPSGYANPDNLTAAAEVVVKNPDDEPVVFADSNLQHAVCAALKKTSDYTPTLGDMKSLTKLDASNWDITDLTGLWTAVNLETLDLSGNLLTASASNLSAWHAVLNGIEALTKLKELNLSGCDLGINPTSPSQSTLPNCLWFNGINLLGSLEKLDLSGNHLKREFNFNANNTKLANLQELDLSDNQLNAVNLNKDKFSNLEKIDISGNYITFDESDAAYQYIVDMGVEKFVYAYMKNRADLYSLKVNNAGATTTHYVAEGQYTVDAGTLLGDNLTFNCQVFSAYNFVKVTVDGKKYTAGSVGGTGNAISLSGLELDQDHTITFEVMHLSQEARTYTLKFTTKALPAGSAGITDANLQKAVCTKLGQDPATYSVSIADMNSLTGAFSVAGLTNAEGIQYATGLTGLSLAGTFAGLPDPSGLTELTALTLDSPNLTAIPSLANQAKVKTLTIKNAAGLTALPAVTGMTALTTITLTGGSNLSLPAGLSSLSGFTTLSVTDSEGFDFTGIGDTAMATLTIDATESFTLAASGSLKALTITNGGLTELSPSVSEMTALTSLVLTNNKLAALPDLSGLTSLATLTLTSNSLTAIPASVPGLSSLKSLKMDKNPTAEITADLSGLTGLEELILNQCALQELDESLWTLPALKTLDLDFNKLRRIDAPMAGLTSLTTLKLRANKLVEFPAGIKDLPAIQTLDLAYNIYTDLPAELVLDASSTKLTALKTFYYGGCIRCAEGSSNPAPGTVAAQVRESMMTYRSVNPFLVQNRKFSELKTLDSSLGEITQIYEALNPTYFQEYTLTANEETTSITLTPTALHDDSTITVNGTAVANGGSIEVPLQKGLNTVSIVCYNAYILGTSDIHTTTYNLKIMVGAGAIDDFPAEGKTYSIGLRLKKELDDSYSMADNYFTHSAEFTYDAAQEAFVMDVTVTKHSWIPEMNYRDESGAYVEAQRLSVDEAADTAVYRMVVKDLEAELYISPYVVPMGYAPICRIIFDTDSIIDITGEEPEPGDLADGTYTIDADALKEHSDELSMTNQFLTEPARLTVADGQITLTMVWHGTSLIPMTMVEGLWYQDSSGEFVEITRNIDAGANTLTFSMPLAGITEPVMMKVYAPQGMGETYPLFRLVFNKETLTPVTGEERAVYTLTPIEDEVYQAGTTPDGIRTMTVNPGFSGLKYFGVQVTPVTAHSGKEAVVFTHQRDEAQLSLNVIKSDFDAVQEAQAQAGFNVLAGDVIKVYIVDDLTNDPDTNPIILQ